MILAGLLHFGAALTDLEARVAFADDVQTSTTADNFAIFAAVLEGTDGAYDLHNEPLTGSKWFFQSLSS